MDVTYIKNIQKTGSTHVQPRKMKQSQAHKSELESSTTNTDFR